MEYDDQGLFESAVQIERKISQQKYYQQLLAEINDLQAELSKDLPVSACYDLCLKLHKKIQLLQQIREILINIVYLFNGLDREHPEVKKLWDFVYDGKLKQAEQFIKTLVDSESNNKEDYATILQFYALLLLYDTQNPNREAQAKAYFRKAIDVYPTADMFFDYGRFLEVVLLEEKAGERMYRKALTRYRKLYQKQPAVYGADLAAVLSRLADIHVLDPKSISTESEYQGALALFVNLNEDKQGYFFPFICTAFQKLACYYNNQNLLGPAQKCLQTAVLYFSKLAEADPDHYIEKEAIARSDLGALYYNCNKPKAAAEQFKKSAGLFGTFIQDMPTLRADYANLLENMAIVEALKNQNEAARQKFVQVIAMRQREAWDNPDLYFPAVAKTKTLFAKVLSRLGKKEDAIAELEEALRIYEVLSSDDPDAFLQQRSEVLKELLGLLPQQDKQFAQAAYRRAMSGLKEEDFINPYSANAKWERKFYAHTIRLMADLK
ncbi:MAG: tetratricopeptide repeat protein [Erysipelotrichaceae bacterium]|jgi:tetratricopeptide (TPR) repeat protein|nr:tetratricopeptide repeat protein [Erysipelotrichaceae bacterium]